MPMGLCKDSLPIVIPHNNQALLEKVTILPHIIMSKKRKLQHFQNKLPMFNS